MAAAALCTLLAVEAHTSRGPSEARVMSPSELSSAQPGPIRVGGRVIDVAGAQLVLAWTLARPAVTSVIVGASRPEQVVKNAESVAIELAPDVLERLDTL